MSKLLPTNLPKKIQDVILCFYVNYKSIHDNIIRRDNEKDCKMILCAPTETFYIDETIPKSRVSWYKMKKNGLLYYDSENHCYNILGHEIPFGKTYIYNIMDILGLKYDKENEYLGHEFKYALTIGQIRPEKIKSLESYLNFILEENDINVQINFKKYKNGYKQALKSFYNFVDFTNSTEIC
tara:strand:- start:1564 stop:2109 length:546 start_codon:yes stop_codon:yes gene_type:complete